jgi:hypothetical protein
MADEFSIFTDQLPLVTLARLSDELAEIAGSDPAGVAWLAAALAARSPRHAAEVDRAIRAVASGGGPGSSPEIHASPFGLYHG